MVLKRELLFLCHLKYYLFLALFFLIINCSTINASCNFKQIIGGNQSSSRIKGMFVFGSSLVDNGNNNFLADSIAKANYLPYGIDFPEGPSGRFTNGQNVVDLLGHHLNLPSLLPVFSDPSTKGPKVLHGVNYASGASGILDDTGFLAGHVISLKEQIRNFEEFTVAEMEAELGCQRGEEMLSDYLFVVGSGGNDYSFNYFLTKSYGNVTLEAFTTNLISLLSHHLKRLYNAGGRKFVLISVNPIGCSPMAKALYAPRRTRTGGCLQGLNKAAHLFNSHLKSLTDSLKIQMPGSNLVLVNSYKIIRDIIKNPASTGFKDASRGCCEVVGIGEGGTGILCKRGGETCTNRSSDVFFDGLHPTEAVNAHIASKAFASYLKAEVYPINVSELSKL